MAYHLILIFYKCCNCITAAILDKYGTPYLIYDSHLTFSNKFANNLAPELTQNSQKYLEVCPVLICYLSKNTSGVSSIELYYLKTETSNFAG